MTDHTAEAAPSCGAPIDGEPEPCGLPAGHDEHMSPNVIGWQRALGGPVPGEPLAQGGIVTTRGPAIVAEDDPPGYVMPLRNQRERAAYERGKAEGIAEATRRATAATLRQVAGWGAIDEGELHRLAGEVETLPAPDGSLGTLCCPMCEEVDCDTGCPLAPVRTSEPTGGGQDGQ